MAVVVRDRSHRNLRTRSSPSSQPVACADGHVRESASARSSRPYQTRSRTAQADRRRVLGIVIVAVNAIANQKRRVLLIENVFKRIHHGKIPPVPRLPIPSITVAATTCQETSHNRRKGLLRVSNLVCSEARFFVDSRIRRSVLRRRFYYTHRRFDEVSTELLRRMSPPARCTEARPSLADGRFGPHYGMVMESEGRLGAEW